MPKPTPTPKPAIEKLAFGGTIHLTASPTYAQKELVSLTHLLHLVHHHNKNQHRLSKWYKALCTFRHQVSKLLVEVQELDTALAFSVINKTKDGRLGGDKMGKEGKYVRGAREKVEERVNFWGGRCMERWFVAFSNLTADGQYASLGLTLLGCLAKARSIVRPFSKNQKPEETEVEVIEDSDHLLSLQKENDLGEVVKREQLQEQAEVKRLRKPVFVDTEIDIDEDDIGTQKKQARKNKRKIVAMENTADKPLPSIETSEKPKKKKKKKGGDAFDDLFASLV